MEFNTIQDFRRNFTQVYHSSVAPELDAFEKTKEQQKMKVNIVYIVGVIVIAIILYIFNFKFTQECTTSIVFTIMTCFSLKKWFCKKFEKTLKQTVMPIIMKAFGNFVWVNSSVIDSYTLKESRIFGRFDEKRDDDCFFGTYKGLAINIDETELYYITRDSDGHRHKHIEFKGVIAQIDFSKNFKGHTIIRRRGLLNSKVYEEVKLEDPEFSKMYFVDGSDQVESRYILTTSFMERFKNIKNAFSASQMEASIKDNKIIIAISTTRDLFKLGDIYKPVNDTKQFTKMLDEFVSILEIVDELKLNQNIGL